MFFVAEIGSNWDGSLDKARQLIRECRDAGADAVKFQMWRADDLYNGKYKEYELHFDQVLEIKRYCDVVNMEFFCSVFYPEAVDFLEKLGVKRYKLASRTLTREDPYSIETIEAVFKTNKEVIFSNGFGSHVFMSTYDKQVKELYCIPEYPTDPDKIDWHLANMCHGFSDHTLGVESAIKYYKMNRDYPDKILEKHVRLINSKGPDAFFSITTQEFAEITSN